MSSLPITYGYEAFAVLARAFFAITLLVSTSTASTIEGGFNSTEANVTAALLKKGLVTTKFIGTNDDPCAVTVTPSGTSFVIGTGSSSSQSGTACGNDGKVTWSSIKGNAPIATEFKIGGDIDAEVVSLSPSKPASLSVEGKFRFPDTGDVQISGGTGAVIKQDPPPEKKVDATGIVESSLSTDLSLTLDGSPLLSIETVLSATSGAIAEITASALELIVSAGAGVASYEITTFNALDGSQSFSWAVSYDGSILDIDAPGFSLSAGDFTAILDGFSLPIGLLPTLELTADAVSGALVFSGADTAFAAAIPEPSTVLLLASGLIGIAIAGRRRRL